jgi:hypothetical protein
MPAYTSGSTKLGGTLGTSAMNASTAYTFEIVNNSDQFKANQADSLAYLTIEGNSTANQSLAETVVITGSFSFNNDSIASGSLLEDGNRFSISSNGAGGTFTFTPTTNIRANRYFIRTVGNINVTIT